METEGTLKSVCVWVCVCVCVCDFRILTKTYLRTGKREGCLVKEHWWAHCLNTYLVPDIVQTALSLWPLIHPESLANWSDMKFILWLRNKPCRLRIFTQGSNMTPYSKPRIFWQHPWGMEIEYFSVKYNRWPPKPMVVAWRHVHQSGEILPFKYWRLIPLLLSGGWVSELLLMNRICPKWECLASETR